MEKFKLVSPYEPMGDQIEAIKRISENLAMGIKEQTLLGATGTGKTFTIANVIEQVQKPTLIIAHNKTLAAQLYNEFKELGVKPEDRLAGLQEVLSELDELMEDLNKRIREISDKSGLAIDLVDRFVYSPYVLAYLEEHVSIGDAVAIGIEGESKGGLNG